MIFYTTLLLIYNVYTYDNSFGEKQN